MSVKRRADDLLAKKVLIDKKVYVPMNYSHFFNYNICSLM